MPKEPKENLRWRLALRKRCEQDPAIRKAVLEECRRNLLFFVNVFGMIYEPRQAAVLPFITYPFQDETLLQLDGVIGKSDAGIEKSRDMGATWMILYVFLWRWLFQPMQSYLVVSRNADLVDKTGSPDSLFWKIDFILKYLPVWMKPVIREKVERQNMMLMNPVNGSVIEGAATSEDIGRGGRRTAIMIDEFGAFDIAQSFKVWASSEATTETRIVNSTPKGGAGMFAKLMRGVKKAFLKIRLHWTRHPRKNPGMYTSKPVSAGRDTRYVLEVLDKDYAFAPDYEFVLDGKVRSPWYDKTCERLEIDQLVAQEHDIGYEASDFQFFKPEVLDRLKLGCRPPVLVGDLDYTVEGLKPGDFTEVERGRLKLWIMLGADGKPPKSKYSVGVDISGGTGSSNSVAVVFDQMIGLKVAEWSSNLVVPQDFCEIVIALCRWFQSTDRENAYAVWESNGTVGKQFLDRMLDTGFRNFYYRTAHHKMSQKISDEPGWHSGKESKKQLLGDYRTALREGSFVNLSEESLIEAGEYVYTSKGSVEHSPSQNSIDLTDLGDDHGDRVIADALAWFGARNRRVQVEELEPTAPVGSIAWEVEQRKRQEKTKELW